MNKKCENISANWIRNPHQAKTRKSFVKYATKLKPEFIFRFVALLYWKAQFHFSSKESQFILSLVVHLFVWFQEWLPLLLLPVISSKNISFYWIRICLFFDCVFVPFLLEMCSHWKALFPSLPVTLHVITTDSQLDWSSFEWANDKHSRTSLPVKWRSVLFFGAPLWFLDPLKRRLWSIFRG